MCPVFRLVGGHVFGKIYTGGIGTILTAWFDELKKSDDIQSLCIQCGNCVEVCPGKIDIPGLILELRRRLAWRRGSRLAQKAIFSVVNNRQAVPLHAARRVRGAKALREGRLHPPPAVVPVRYDRIPQSAGDCR